MDEKFLLYDRIDKIQQIITLYGEENFYLSFSGGKDSCVLSKLMDVALPKNQIPRVFADTGIEYNLIRTFVYRLAETDPRIEIIKPSCNIQTMLKEEGYPFKSKEHSAVLDIYQRCGADMKTVDRYIHPSKERRSFGCPKMLLYQFTPDFTLRVSDKCCERMKEEPLIKWQKDHNRPYSILGIMPEEGGRRKKARCLAFDKKTFKSFHPLVAVTKEWEEWFIEAYEVELCDLYKPPFNLDRTGCKGCPFNIDIEDSLRMMAMYFPDERKQCETIWGPVYEEYRRIGYRLTEPTGQLSLWEF